MNNLKITKEFFKGIQNLNADDVINVVDIGIDQFIDDDFIDGLPAIGNIIKAIKLPITIRDRMFLVKVAKFLYSSNLISDTDKHQFSSKIANDTKFTEKLGNTILLILDKYNDYDKPIILAKAFKWFINDRINYDEFIRLATSLDVAHLDDINELASENCSQGTLRTLLSTGLTYFDVGKNFGQSGQVKYFRNRIAELLINIINESQ
jgi:hypothetical protein